MAVKKYNVVEEVNVGAGTIKHTYVTGPHKWETAWRRAAALNREAVREWKRRGLSAHDAPFFTTQEL